jgi:CheY-like chemotaxis protein
MGGDISLTSEMGKGSTFSFHFGIELAAAEDLLATDRLSSVIGLAPDQPEFRILIVEDNPQNRDLLVKMLQPMGFQIREAVNGQEAVEMSEEWTPNLIFMDMRMPVMDGFEATRRIKSDPKGKKTKIVAVTASVFKHEQELVMEAGCDDFIRKPIRSEEIFETLARHLGVRFKYSKLAEDLTEHIERMNDEEIRERLRAMPPEWVSRLNEAAVAGDIEVTAALVEEIRERDEALSDTLRGLAKRYRLDKLVAITEKMEC